MNGAHWHLVVNHLPIIFPIVGVTVMVTGFVSKSEAVKRTALMVFILGGLAAIAAISTGEGAEEAVEHLNGISKQLIKNHEETAETFTLLSYALGGLSIVGLWASFRQKSFATAVAIGTVLFALIVLFFGSATGTTGGEIRHSEIRNVDHGFAGDGVRGENGRD